jgi:hypothetical protein
MKKDKYFKTQSGISPFVLTTQVLNQDAWTPEILEVRQEQLVASLGQLWRL